MQKKTLPTDKVLKKFDYLRFRASPLPSALTAFSFRRRESIVSVLTSPDSATASQELARVRADSASIAICCLFTVEPPRVKIKRPENSVEQTGTKCNPIAGSGFFW